VTVPATFGALADPTRLAMVRRLSRGEATMGELAAPHDMSLPAITKHLRVLVDAGLVSRRKIGRSVVCRLRTDSLDEARAWLGDVTTYWNANLDRLGELLGHEEQES
jgi:DNA-binding transcriptional ArsR family regulator